MHPVFKAVIAAAGIAPQQSPKAFSTDLWWTGPAPVHVLGAVGRFLNITGALWTAALMILICCDVASRSLYDQPLPRVPEFVGYSISAIVFLQITSAIRSGRLTRADIVIETLMIRRPFAGAIFNAVFHLFGALVMGLIAYGLVPEAIEAYEEAEYFGQRGELIIYVWPFRAVMGICAVLAALEFLVLTADYLRKALQDEPDHFDARQGLPKGWVPILTLAAALFLGWLVISPADSGLWIASVLVAAMLFLIIAGMQIAIVMILLSFIGTWYLRDSFAAAINLLKIASTGAIQDQLFGVVPLFVLMGLLVNAGRIGRDTFDVCQWLLQKITGGLGIATVIANAIFAAVTGVSIASAVVFTRVSVPPMLEHGYTPRFAVGVVAGSSVLGMLIPPSLLLVVFGVVAEVSVGALFNAAILPGLLLSSGFCVMIVLMAKLTPDAVGRLKEPDTTNLPPTWTRKPPHTETARSALVKIIPISVLILIVIGGIYGGIFTPTEAGAVGAFFALIIVCAKTLFEPGLITLRGFWKILIDTGHISVSILFLIIGANMYTRMIALSGMPGSVIDWLLAAEFGFYGIIVGYLLVVLVMGMILDSVSIMLITLPLILPTLATFNADLIWFGIVTVVAVEIGLLTPPLGLTVYVVKAALGNTQITLSEIFKGAFPFVIVMIVVTALLVAFPMLTEITRRGF
jgi:tripartite ATP-independent transporter DctM subunit